MSVRKRVKLGEICSRVCSGGTPRSSVAEYYDGGSIPWLNTKEVTFGRIYSTEKCITELGLENSSAKWIEANAVVVAMYGATAGNVAITRIPLTTNQACCNLQINPEKADADFVFYYLKWQYHELCLLANGAAQQNLNAQVIKDFQIGLPDLPTQQRIAAVLGALDDKIEVNRKICENLEAQAQALFKAWFVDFEPFGGKCPAGWKMGKLVDVAAIHRESITPDEMDEIVEHYSLPAFDESKFPAYDTSESIKSNKFKIGKNSVLLSKLNPRIKRLWDPFVDTESAVASTEFIVFEPFKVAFRYFVYAILDSEGLYQYSVAHAAGTTNSHQRVTPDDILEYEIVLPSEEDILKYCGVVEPMYASMKRRIKESRALAAMRDALLPKLMSGELAVEKVEV